MRTPKYGTTHVAKTGVSMPQPLLPLVDEAAANNGTNRSVFISQVLAAYFDYELKLNKAK